MFPFLAVLICTMGALIAVLVVGVQQARLDAAQDNELLDSQHQQQIEIHKQRQLEIENYQWRSEILVAKRDEYQDQVQQNRLKLAQLETHILELEGRWQALLNKARMISDERMDSSRSQIGIENEIARLQQKIFAAKSELEQARVDAQQGDQSYAIIPYQGEHGTHRRPVYLECVAEGVLIQPERILISHADLDGPSGVGNPLNACLRTIREFYARHTGDDDESPYPLLIVRPEGVMAFGKARKAMADWKDEYGFELVSDDLPLSFPNPQPALSGELKKTIALAQDRQRALAMAMPSRFPNQPAGQQPEPADMRFETTIGASDGLGDGQQDSGEQLIRPGTGGTDSRTADSSLTPEPDNASGPGAQGLAAGGRAGGGMAVPPGGVGMPGRQQGWALGKSQRGPAITRPVKVICETHRLTIVPSAGERGELKVVELEETVKGNIDQFVAALHEHIDQWGIAIAGGHWKPELKVVIRSGGEARFEQLRYVLYGSGIPVWRHTD